MRRFSPKTSGVNPTDTCAVFRVKGVSPEFSVGDSVFEFPWRVGS